MLILNTEPEKTMRKYLTLTVLVVSLLIAAQAMAAEKRIVFINSTEEEIKAIYLVPAGTKKWDKNLLNKYKLKPGTRTDIAVPHDRGNCIWDLRYVVREKLGYTIQSVDICKAVEIELFLKDDQAWANIK
jgi:hypothetical protein